MNKQISFSPYPQQMLLEGFSYPQSYLKLSQDTSTINWSSQYLFPWWFEDHGTEGAELAYRFRKSDSDIVGLNLIPFAQNGDWEAYFNADDTSGNPQVIVIDLSDTKYVSYCDDFDSWLKMAEQNGWT
ncbi:hypothetical protein ACFBZI_07360 [Moraxella sp. ZJ142]|uniref:hypothetical protein n=1 Tax=Moraxella marmotae TaxID=3344520 RepID=UPI0035D49D55